MSPSLSSFQRFEARFYSATASWLYDRVVVSFGFRLLAGRLHSKVLAQGTGAVQAAGHRPILDLPVGTAFFTLRWGRGGFVVGADIAAGMVEEAKSRADGRGAEWLSTAQADVQHLPFRDRSFGAIMCTNGLQVMPPLPLALAELGRVLDHAGSLFVCMITFPVGALLPLSLSKHLPTIFKSHRQVLAELRSEGWKVTARDRSRLALLFEACRT
ncbi:MAG: methyltransferase domain-containing protein [Actinobacteria bacterium]|nr:methyltransferase domain-containing protein [Actinomycetota bacterium]